MWFFNLCLENLSIPATNVSYRLPYFLVWLIVLNKKLEDDSTNEQNVLNHPSSLLDTKVVFMHI